MCGEAMNWLHRIESRVRLDYLLMVLIPLWVAVLAVTVWEAGNLMRAAS
jgi:hypothetical protein